MTRENAFQSELASGPRDHVVRILRNDNICVHPLVHVAANRDAVRARQGYSLGNRTGCHSPVHLPVSEANNMDVVQAKVGVPQLEFSRLHHQDMRDKRAFFLIDLRAREIKLLSAGDVIDPYDGVDDSSLFDVHRINLFNISADRSVTRNCEPLWWHWLPAVQDAARDRTSIGGVQGPDHVA